MSLSASKSSSLSSTFLFTSFFSSTAGFSFSSFFASLIAARSFCPSRSRAISSSTRFVSSATFASAVASLSFSRRSHSSFPSAGCQNTAGSLAVLRKRPSVRKYDTRFFRLIWRRHTRSSNCSSFS